MTPEERSAQQWGAIVALLRAQMGAGKKLPTVQDVRQSIDLWTGVQPAIGVQLFDLEAKAEFTQKHHTYATFYVLVSAQSLQTGNATTITPANLDDAMGKLQVIVADGNGNGVCNILRAPANFTLGGLAIRTMVTGVKYSWEIGRGAGTTDQVWAHALITYVVEDLVAIH